jgi:hypothetical protein
MGFPEDCVEFVSKSFDGSATAGRSLENLQRRSFNGEQINLKSKVTMMPS